MRTEKEVLKDFEKMGWTIKINTNKTLIFQRLGNDELEISKEYKEYWSCNESSIAIYEHKLLNELFSIWGWL
jgi:hypothetical protein